ncbi:MAG: xanthine dehydrogenase [Chloroflexi bacterium]|nr:xanthine dehydrogenase [Chloroflexota bacterium]
MGKIYQALRAALDAERPVGLATVVDGVNLGNKMLVYDSGEPAGSLGDDGLDRGALDQVLRLLRIETNETVTLADNAGQETRIFVEVFLPSPKLIVIGAVHTAIPLAIFAKEMGFKTIVADARGKFATDERFPHVDVLLNLWPDEALAQYPPDASTYIVILTHDPKFDDPAVKLAVASPARYIGALGSNKTHTARLERLRAEGVPEDQLQRIHAPIGLDIGARSPQELAISILGEMIAAKYGLTAASRAGQAAGPVRELADAQEG